MSITDIGKEAAENSQSNQGGSEYERFDISGLPFVKMHPTTAVAGTPVALRYFGGNPDEEGYGRGFAGLILDDPSVLSDDDDLTGATIFAADDEKGDDYRVVNTDDNVTREVDGTGVDFDGNIFYGTPTDEFEEDRIILKLTGNSGRSATCTLDVHGKGGADVVRDDDGTPVLNDNGWPEYNGALIEHHPDNDDDNYVQPRFARDPELRPDVEGEQVAFMVQRLAEIDEDYEGSSYWSTVTHRESDDDDWGELAPTDEYDPSVGLLQETKWMEWAYPDSDTIEELREAQGFDDE